LKEYAVILISLLLLCGCKEEITLVVTTDSVSGISHTTATVTGNASSSAFIIECGICWSNILSAPSRDNDYNSTIGKNGSFSLTMHDLTPGSKYYVRAYANHNYESTEYGNVITFSTTGDITGAIKFNADLAYSSINDVDGNTYQTIEIGTQTWMAENLKTTKFSDGTQIPIATVTQWRYVQSPAYCWYVDDGEKYKNTYGALYNWQAVNTGKLCPDGWHLPTDNEWEILTTYLGGGSIADRKLRETGSTHWVNNSSEANNNSGFTALPGGFQIVTDGIPQWQFVYLGYDACFWSSTPQAGSIPLILGRSFHWQTENFGMTRFLPEWGCSVRCIKDSE
jgi:uncharacterized protein (TIGR02145 family)